MDQERTPKTPIRTDWLRLVNLPGTLDPISGRLRTRSIPAVFIGLGGAGYQVINKVKGKLVYAVSKDFLPKEILDYYRFIYYDSDSSMKGKEDFRNYIDIRGKTGEEGLEWINPLQLSPYNQKEDAIHVVWENTSIDEVRKLKEKLTPGQLKWMTDTLNEALTDESGFGTNRLLGRLGFLCMDGKREISAGIGRFIKYLKTIKKINNPDVYLVIAASMCGGTGSSTFLDLAAYIRNYTLNALEGCRIWPIMLLIGPEVMVSSYGHDNADKKDKLRAHAYAILRELNWFYSQKAEYQVDLPDRQSYHIAFERKREAPFPFIFLIDELTRDGHKFNGIHDLSEMIADVLIQLLPGGAFSAVRSNLVDAAAGDHIFIKPESNSVTFLSSFGGITIEVPQDILALYTSNKLALDWINRYAEEEDRVTGRAPSATEEELSKYLFDEEEWGKDDKCLIECLGIGSLDDKGEYFKIKEEWLDLRGVSAEIEVGDNKRKIPIKNFDNFIQKHLLEKSLPEIEEEERSIQDVSRLDPNGNLNNYWDKIREYKVVDSWKERIHQTYPFDRSEDKNKSNFYVLLESLLQEDLDKLRDALNYLVNEVIDGRKKEISNEKRKLRNKYNDLLTQFHGRYEEKAKAFEDIKTEYDGSGWLGRLINSLQEDMQYSLEQIKRTVDDHAKSARGQIKRFIELNLEFHFYKDILLKELKKFIEREITEGLEDILMSVRMTIQEDIETLIDHMSEGCAKLGSSYEDMTDKLIGKQSTRVLLPSELLSVEENAKAIEVGLQKYYRLLALEDTDWKKLNTEIKAPITIRQKGVEKKIEIVDWAQDIPKDVLVEEILGEKWVENENPKAKINRSEIIRLHIIEKCKNWVFLEEFDPEAEGTPPQWKDLFNKTSFIEDEDFLTIGRMFESRGSEAININKKARDYVRVLIKSENLGDEWLAKKAKYEHVVISLKASFPNSIHLITIASGFTPATINQAQQWRRAYDKLWKDGHDQPLHIFPTDVVNKMPHPVLLPGERVPGSVGGNEEDQTGLPKGESHEADAEE